MQEVLEENPQVLGTVTQPLLCDKCSARAMVLVNLPYGELTFCNHHYNEYDVALTNQGGVAKLINISTEQDRPMSMMGPVNPRQNIPTGGGYRPGRLLGAVFGGLASIKQRRSMAQIQFDLHSANAATDLQNKKDLINHQAAVSDFAHEQQSKRNLRYVGKYNQQSIKHAINSTEALKNYAEENGLAKPTAIQPIVNIAGFNKFGPQFQNVGTVVHERREGPAGGDPKKGGKGKGTGGASKPRNPKKPSGTGGAARKPGKTNAGVVVNSQGEATNVVNGEMPPVGTRRKKASTGGGLTEIRNPNVETGNQNNVSGEPAVTSPSKPRVKKAATPRVKNSGVQSNG